MEYAMSPRTATYDEASRIAWLAMRDAMAEYARCGGCDMKPAMVKMHKALAAVGWRHHELVDESRLRLLTRLQDATGSEPD